MIHATLQMKTSSHRALRKKTLAVIKDSSGRPILFCSFTPRSKKRNERAKSLSPKGIGAKPWALAQGVKSLSPKGIGAKQKKESSISSQEGALATRGKLKQQSKSPNGVQQRYGQKRTQPGMKRKAASKWNGFAPFLTLRSFKPQSQRRRRLIVSFLKKLASRQSTRFAYGEQRASDGDLLKSLRGNHLSLRLRHKSLDLEAKLLGLKLGKACIFKGIQSIDVVIQEYTKPTCLLLQGLRMAGVRFNRLRILRAADYDVNSLSDHEIKPLGLARQSSRSFFPSLKGSNFEKRSTPNLHVPLPIGSEAWGVHPISNLISEAVAPHLVPLPKETKTLKGGNRDDCVSWLLDISPKNELLQILVKSRLIKTSTRQTFWQARSFKYKIEKLLYRKNRRGVIKERVYCPLIQKKAVKKWKAFTDFSIALRAKEQAFVQRTPFYRLRRSFAPFLSKSSSITYHLPPKVRKKIKKRVAWLRPKKLHIFEKYGSSRQKSGSFQRRPRFRVNQTRIIANVQNTLNNTIITITDRFGNTKVWCSSGSIGLKASRRSTNYAAQSVAEAVAKKCRKLGIRRVEVRVHGVGYGKPSALKGLRIGGLQIKRIIDTTPKPHNGCRAPKKRRV